MKVSDVMQKSIITITEKTPLKEVGRLIFSLGIAGVPVVRDKKLIGIVTEHDLLSRMYPTMQELVEDYAHARDFEAMEKNILDLLEMPVEKVMNKNVISVPLDTPLMKAQSLMLLNKFSRLPVVDKNKNLIGIITQGDIFRQVLKDEIPQIERERYAGFIARHYDLMVNWEKRLAYEFPVLFKLFKKERVRNILDIGTWTGEYSLALARRGVKILGLDHNSIMIKISEEKKKKLPLAIKKNAKFMLTDFAKVAGQINERFDAAICMGNALPYIPVLPRKLFKDISGVLRDKNSVVIIQLLNFEKLLKKQDRLISFIIQKSNLAYEKEHLFIEFFDKKEDNLLLHHVIIFDFDGKNWVFKGVTTVPIHYITKATLRRALKEAGFKKISFAGNIGKYQGEYGKLSFTAPFKPLESDWLNVIARK